MELLLFDAHAGLHLIAAAFVCLFGVTVFHHLVRDGDSQEPPLVPQKIPYFGHVIGLLRYGLGYFDVISARQKNPIFTVSLLGQKTYVITSPELVKEVQKNTKTMSFSPAMIPAFQRMLGTDDVGIELIFRDAHTENGFYGEIHSIQKASLLPGTTSLEQLSSAVRSKLMADINACPSDPQLIHLYSWIQDLFMKSNNSACFGPQDPFTRYPDLDKVFWDFVQNLSVLLLGVPWILAPKSYATAHQCRQRLVEVFHDYLIEGGAQHACSFVYELCQLSVRRGLSNENTARALVGSILAIVGNTIPTTFWILAHVYSDPSLLAEIRRELEATLPRLPGDTPRTVQIDAAVVRERCPLFISTYEEVLRMTAGISTVRYTTADTLVSDRWLLEKGSTVQMPTAFIHADPSTWGSDSEVFRPDRFLNTKSLPKSEQSKRAAAFRPFGGGTTLCPGRHFAYAEVVSFACSVLLGMEMAPMGGVWKLPKKDKSKMPLTSLKPVTDIEIEISRRAGWESVFFS